MYVSYCNLVLLLMVGIVSGLCCYALVWDWAGLLWSDGVVSWFGFSLFLGEGRVCRFFGGGGLFTWIFVASGGGFSCWNG